LRPGNGLGSLNRVGTSQRGNNGDGYSMNSGIKKIGIAAVVAVAALATMAEGSSSGDGDTIVESSDDSAAEDSAESDSAGSEEAEGDDSGGDDSGVGTRGNPAPLGSVARVGDWEISVVEVNQDAAAVVAEENEFNDPPEDGFNFVLWNIEAEYVGEESGTLWVDTSWKVVGSDGNTFDESCGVIPDSVSDVGETFSGASIAGNDCVAVEASQLDGASILVEASFSFDDDRTFFAIS